MVKVVNIFKAAGLWVGTIFLLYGATDVERQVATQYYGGFGTALAPSRSAEGGKRKYGGQASVSREFELAELQLSPSVGAHMIQGSGLTQSRMSRSTSHYSVGAGGMGQG